MSASSQYAYVMKSMTKSFPGAAKPVLNQINLQFYRGAKIGIVGPNGAGKSTLMKIMAGIDTDFSGEAWPGENITVGYLPQEPHLDPDKTVMENVMEGVADKQAVLDRYNELMMNYSDETAEEGAKLQDVIDAQNLWDLENQVEMAMDALRCPPADANVVSLSGGERRRVALCKLLLSKPDILLLDEPTNDLDVDTLRALEDALEGFAGCVVVISHDRWFLDRIATHIVAFEGNSHVEFFSGNYADYEADRKRRLGAEADRPHRIKFRKLTRA